PVGGVRAIPVDIRLVAATHHDLDARVAAGRFRADLYGRIAGWTLELPPLRARIEDLGLLTAALLGRERTGEVTLSAEAGRALVRVMGKDRVQIRRWARRFRIDLESFR